SASRRRLTEREIAAVLDFADPVDCDPQRIGQLFIRCWRRSSASRRRLTEREIAAVLDFADPVDCDPQRIGQLF
ncbi:hypothetical protein CNY89_29915, partial [Amaricoccus sp. HAR-UPW-R2A-40]